MKKIRAFSFISLPIRELVEDYKTNKHAVREFAERHGVTIQTVYNKMRAMGVSIRRGGDASSGTQAREKNPNWKSGTTRRKDGYILEYVDGRQRFQHRLVMERHLGRPLKDDEVVHHINGDKSDNRIENLELFANNGEHHKDAHYDRKRLSDAGKMGNTIRWSRALKAQESPQ